MRDRSSPWSRWLSLQRPARAPKAKADDATAETQQLIQRLWSDLDRAGQRTLCDLAEQRDIDEFFTEDPLPSGQMPDTAEIYRFLRDRCE